MKLRTWIHLSAAAGVLGLRARRRHSAFALNCASLSRGLGREFRGYLLLFLHFCGNIGQVSEGTANRALNYFATPLLRLSIRHGRRNVMRRSTTFFSSGHKPSAYFSTFPRGSGSWARWARCLGSSTLQANSALLARWLASYLWTPERAFPGQLFLPSYFYRLHSAPAEALILDSFHAAWNAQALLLRRAPHQRLHGLRAAGGARPGARRAPPRANARPTQNQVNRAQPRTPEKARSHRAIN